VLDELFGVGGMGQVLAVQRSIDRTVVVKLPPDLADDLMVRQRFRIEVSRARASRTITCPRARLRRAPRPSVSDGARDGSRLERW
jgi:hypothetical protein